MSEKLSSFCAEKVGIDYPERRSYERAPGMLTGCLIYSDGGRLTDCVLLDISATGAKIKFDKTPGDGEAVNLRLGQRLKIGAAIDFPIKVVWQDGPVVGLRFLNEPHEVAGALEELLPPEPSPASKAKRTRQRTHEGTPLEGTKDGPAEVPARTREALQDLVQNRFEPRNRKEVPDLIADVSGAMCDEPPARPAATEPNRAPSAVMARQGGGADRGRVIVVGSEKGGTGKSTTAMHLIVSLLYAGHRVGSMDLDSPQWSLSRYLENRQRLNREHKLNLSCPEHVDSPDSDKESGLFEDDLNHLVNACDFVVIDTPGRDTAISRMAHSWANIVITPINDSFVDLDTLAVLDPDGQQIRRRGHYADMIAHARKQKIARTGEGFDWVVLRNRLSSLDARNKQRMADVLNSLASYLDFRNCAGLGERVIFRELFLRGLTLLDLREQSPVVTLSMSHLAARQELRALLQAIGISEAAGAKQSQVAVG